MAEQSVVSLLNQGRFANATVWLCRMHGADWVVKDFRHKSPLVRWTVGRFLLGREMKALQKLSGIPGVPQEAQRVDADAIAFRFVPGQTINAVPTENLRPDFFPQLEQLVGAIHERGIAHLDMRYRRNILVRDDGGPGIIDFQSSIGLGRLPGWLRRHFQRVDISGVYKHWLKRSPATLDDERRSVIASHNRWRKFWIFKGYIGLGRKRAERRPVNSG